MIAVLYMIRIIAIVYGLMFLVAGSIYFFGGIGITIATMFEPPHSGGGLGMLFGPLMILWGGFMFMGLIWAPRLLKFSAKGIWPMIWIFIIASVLLWSGQTLWSFSLPLIPPEILNVILTLNLIFIVFLTGPHRYTTMDSQGRETFNITPKQKVLGFSSAIVIVISLLGWTWVHHHIKQTAIQTFDAYHPTEKMKETMNALILDDLKRTKMLGLHMLCNSENIGNNVQYNQHDKAKKESLTRNFIQDNIIAPIGTADAGYFILLSADTCSFNLAVTRSGYEKLKGNKYIRSISLINYSK